MTSRKKFLYLQVYEEIKKNISNGFWSENSQIPTEHELMIEFDVSRDTIRKSLFKLLQEGYIYRQAGKGTFVRNNKSNYKLTILESFSEQMKSRGLHPSSEILDISCVIPSKYITKHLELRHNEEVYKITRIRKADNEPMAYEITYLSKNLCPKIDKKIKNDTSLYQLYEKEYKHKMKYGDVRLEAEIVTGDIAEILKISSNSPILKMQCTVYLESRKPLYYVEASYIGNKYVFSASMPRQL